MDLEVFFTLIHCCVARQPAGSHFVFMLMRSMNFHAKCFFKKSALSKISYKELPYKWKTDEK